MEKKTALGSIHKWNKRATQKYDKYAVKTKQQQTTN